MIQCRTLGPIEITVDGNPAPPELLWRKHLALLLYLARSPRQARSREHLTGMLWGDRTESAARHSLSEALRVIRRHMGQNDLELGVGQVRLSPEAVDLDVDRLEALCAKEEWEEASELVAGEFLEGFSVPDASGFEDWLAAERELWRGRGVEVLVRRAEALCRAGSAQQASGVAGRALTLDPTSEPALRTALRCLALAGDRAGALELFDRFSARLGEIGVEPGEETLALVERVRRSRGRRPRAPRGACPRPIAGPSAHWWAEWKSSRDCSRASHDRCELAGRRCFCSRASREWERRRLLEEMLALVRLDGMSVTAARAVEADRSEPWSGVLAIARGGILDAPGVGARFFGRAGRVRRACCRNGPNVSAKPRHRMASPLGQSPGGSPASGIRGPAGGRGDRRCPMARLELRPRARRRPARPGGDAVDARAGDRAVSAATGAGRASDEDRPRLRWRRGPASDARSRGDPRPRAADAARIRLGRARPCRTPGRDRFGRASPARRRAAAGGGARSRSGDHLRSVAGTASHPRSESPGRSARRRGRGDPSRLSTADTWRAERAHGRRGAGGSHDAGAGRARAGDGSVGDAAARSTSSSGIAGCWRSPGATPSSRGSCGRCWSATC